MKKARKSLSVLLVSLAAALAMPSRSQAGSITYEVLIQHFGPDSFAFVPQFDPSLGPLQSVTIAGGWSVAADVILAEPESSVYYYGPMALALLDQIVYGPVVSGTQFIYPPGYEALISSGGGVSGSLDVTSSFYGTGNISVFPIWFLETTPMSTEISSEYFGEITLTYTYGVPEPPGLILASIAAISTLFLFVRRRLTNRGGSV